jgi:hypothetical protein
LTTDQDRRFCPRCGTGLVSGLPFCPSCGLNSTEGGDRYEPEASDRVDPPADVLGRPLDDGSPAPIPAGTATSPDWRGVAGASASGVRRANLGSSGTAIVLGAVIVAAGLVVFGLLMRPQPGDPASSAVAGPSGAASGQVGPGASPVGPAAPITGITIQSPQDGQAVATKEVTVIGLGPPGLTITRDVSFGFDQHATADGTGHWAISVGLDEGQNDLVFRIGDDHSTEKRVRVIYKPATP